MRKGGWIEGGALAPLHLSGSRRLTIFMEIVSLDGTFDESISVQNEVKKIVLCHSTTKAILPIAPKNSLSKWRIPKSGFYTPIDVRFVLTPHISERANVMAVVKLVDARDCSPSRILYQTKEFNLGAGIVVEGTQLPFCLPVGEYPLQFEVTVSRSQFRETSKLFTTSNEWRMMCSTTPLSRVRSVMGAAQVPAAVVHPDFKMRLESSKGGRKPDGRPTRRGKVTGHNGRCHSDASVGGSSGAMPQGAHAWEGRDYHYGDAESLSGKEY